MSKPFTVNDLSDQMDRDLTWRLRELSDLKTSIRKAHPTSRPALLRALVALMYAHWEGHVKLCANKYFQHIALRKTQYSQLDRQFYINSFLVRMDAFYRSKGSMVEKCKFIEDIMDSQSDRFAYLNPELIDTKANLNTDVITDICRICGVPSVIFEQEKNFIDMLMLKRRNEIAHGEEAYLPEIEMDDMITKVIDMMRSFRNLLENRIYARDYLTKP